MQCAFFPQPPRSSTEFQPPHPHAQYVSLVAHQAPMILLNICHAWTQIALSTTGLWATVEVELPRHEGFEELFEIWLARARHRSLSICISLRSSDEDDFFQHDVAPTIRRRRHQLQSLELDLQGSQAHDAFFDDAAPYPALKTLTIGSKGRMRLVGSSLNILRLAPNLEECTFNGVCYISASEDDRRLERLTVPHLRYLNIDGFRPDLDLLEYLVLPSLETLKIPGVSELQDLFNLLERSSPPLRNLFMGWGRRASGGQLAQCLDLVPTLVHLELSYQAGTDILVQLGTRSPQHYLPNLRTVRITNFSPTSTSAATLKAVLTTRRGHHTPFDSFTLLWPKDRRTVHSSDAAEIVSALREFEGSGMKIHVGPNGMNFMASDSNDDASSEGSF
ncbi:hypothetical protein K438DRAFT_924725 [Mycena galopus ATCC 62051]|nr:hypothetical protein K438DRAFT_924725 [Mycena galopus ATCC 62051]